MIGICERESVRGKEYIFRHNGQLYVFRDKIKAELEFLRLNGGCLF